MPEFIEITVDQLRIARRLEQSCGYLELGMPRQALDNIDGLSTGGALEGALQYVRGQALRMQEKYGDAVAPLEAAAGLLPEGASRHVWLALAECHRANSASDLAANALALARGAKLPLG
ncbi:MAG: hypothetical protein DCC68_23125 [Planctomycetota bacterium]|nr:MAG: hypothetical protein DCC68_23125 [Planctomycetota bacterium]